MKQFFASVFIIVIIFCGLNFELQLQKTPKQQDNISEHLVPEMYFISSDNFDGLNYFAVKKNISSIVQRLLPSNDKFHFSDIFNEKNSESIINNNISDYIFIAECNVNRFEGPDIIYPFNYFW
jgi:hypothetical protein